MAMTRLVVLIVLCVLLHALEGRSGESPSRPGPEAAVNLQTEAILGVQEGPPPRAFQPGGAHKGGLEEAREAPR